MVVTILLGALMFVAAVAAGAVAAAVRRDLCALAESHRALQAKVLALAPAQLDALDAAVSARLVALEAPTDAAVIAALQAAKAAPDASTPAPAEVPPVCAPTPSALTDAEVEAELARRGVGPWVFEHVTGMQWHKRSSPRPVPFGVAYVYVHSRVQWAAELHVTDPHFQDESAGGYLRAEEGVEAAKRRASAALLALLRKHAP